MTADANRDGIPEIKLESGVWVQWSIAERYVPYGELAFVFLSATRRPENDRPGRYHSPP